MTGLQESLIDQLRRATAARHAEVEAVLGLDAPIDLATYARMLGAFDAFLSWWEPNLQQALPEPMRPWFARRCRGAMLRRDLCALSQARMPSRVSDGFALRDFSAALGSLYVLEGSALGGQVIAREMYRQHGLDCGNGAAYFNGWGARTGPMWTEFKAILEHHDAQGVDRQAACDGAIGTFDALIATFTQVLNAASTAAA